jgi:hypothetical protein
VQYSVAAYGIDKTRDVPAARGGSMGEGGLQTYTIIKFFVGSFAGPLL